MNESSSSNQPMGSDMQVLGYLSGPSDISGAADYLEIVNFAMVLRPSLRVITDFCGNLQIGDGNAIIAMKLSTMNWKNGKEFQGSQSKIWTPALQNGKINAKWK